MKQKIKEALKQGHKNLGLSEEVFERVAASVETFITEESQIDGFVKSENTLNLLKSYQSVNDKLRAFENKQKNEQVEQPSNPADQPQNEQQPQAVGGFEQLIKLMQEQNEQMRKQNEVLTARFDAFEAEKKASTALSIAESTFKSNDYVKKYTDECDEAWERAIELYEATGKTWTAEELGNRAMGYFNKKVAKKGVDTTKPFVSDGGTTNDETAAQEVISLLKKEKV